MGATLVGGHTIEGPQLTVGFTLLASQTTEPPRTKGRLRAGDALVLTKPLGTGVLLAAHMRAERPRALVLGASRVDAGEQRTGGAVPRSLRRIGAD
jgi:selenide, water dikinase